MSGGFVIIPDIPNLIEIGIDCMTHEVGPKFRGYSLVPVGLHILYYNVGIGIRQGFFFEVNEGDVLVFPWNVETEEILPHHQLSSDSYNLLKQAIHQGKLNDNLGPYPYSQHKEWKQLSSHISLDILKKASCNLNQMISSEDIYNAPHELNLPTLMNIHEAEVSFNEILNKLPNKQEVLTSSNIDKSNFIQYIIETYYQSLHNLFGELQLSYLLFILLYSSTALTHWKKFIYILCNTYTLLRSDITFSTQFIRILYQQLHYIPDDLFTTELSKDNFLLPSLSALMNNLSTQYDTIIPSVILEHKKRLLTYIQKKYDIFNEDSLLQSIVSDQYYTNNMKAQTLSVSNDSNNNNNNNSSNNMNINDSDVDMSISEHENNTLSTHSHSNNNHNDSSSSNHNNNHSSNNNTTIMMDEYYLQDEDAPVFVPVHESYIHTHCSTSNDYNNQELYPLSNDRNDRVVTTTTTTTTNIITKTPTDTIINNNNNNDNNDNNNVTIENSQKSMNRLRHLEQQHLLYQWRYPHLYEAMIQSYGREDMIMTAVRLYEELSPLYTTTTTDDIIESNIENLTRNKNMNTNTNELISSKDKDKDSTTVDHMKNKILLSEVTLFLDHESSHYTY